MQLNNDSYLTSAGEAAAKSDGLCAVRAMAEWQNNIRAAGSCVVGVAYAEAV